MKMGLRIAFNYVVARLMCRLGQPVYGCGTCGYRFTCGDPPGTECHT